MNKKMNAKKETGQNMVGKWTPQQSIVVYGIVIGLVLTFISLVSTYSLSMLPFHYGYFIMHSGTAGGGAVAVHGFPFGYLGLSPIHTYFAYFAFLLNFIIYTVIGIVVLINYNKMKRN